MTTCKNVCSSDSFEAPKICPNQQCSMLSFFNEIGKCTNIGFWFSRTPGWIGSRNLLSYCKTCLSIEVWLKSFNEKLLQFLHLLGFCLKTRALLFFAKTLLEELVGEESRAADFLFHVGHTEALHFATFRDVCLVGHDLHSLY